jgi:hypothetical protein
MQKKIILLITLFVMFKFTITFNSFPQSIVVNDAQKSNLIQLQSQLSLNPNANFKIDLTVNQESQKLHEIPSCMSDFFSNHDSNIVSKFADLQTIEIKEKNKKIVLDYLQGYLEKFYSKRNKTGRIGEILLDGKKYFVYKNKNNNSITIEPAQEDMITEENPDYIQNLPNYITDHNGDSNPKKRKSLSEEYSDEYIHPVESQASIKHRILARNEINEMCTNAFFKIFNLKKVKFDFNIPNLPQNFKYFSPSGDIDWQIVCTDIKKSKLDKIITSEERYEKYMLLYKSIDEIFFKKNLQKINELILNYPNGIDKGIEFMRFHNETLFSEYQKASIFFKIQKLSKHLNQFFFLKQPYKITRQEQKKHHYRNNTRTILPAQILIETFLKIYPEDLIFETFIEIFMNKIIELILKSKNDFIEKNKKEIAVFFQNMAESKDKKIFFNEHSHKWHQLTEVAKKIINETKLSFLESLILLSKNNDINLQTKEDLLSQVHQTFFNPDNLSFSKAKFNLAKILNENLLEKISDFIFEINKNRIEDLGMFDFGLNARMLHAL